MGYRHAFLSISFLLRLYPAVVSTAVLLFEDSKKTSLTSAVRALLDSNTLLVEAMKHMPSEIRETRDEDVLPAEEEQVEEELDSNFWPKIIAVGFILLSIYN
jgi:hypothetical protein